MGNDETKENEENKINMDEIIENDCYEEVNIKKINKIKEQEKNWNRNSIIYTIKDFNFLEIEEEKKKFQNDNRSEKEKSNENLMNKINEEKLEISPSEEIKKEQDKEQDKKQDKKQDKEQDKEQNQNQNQKQENIQLNENNNNNNLNENKKDKEIKENNDGKKEEINNIDNSKKENQNGIVVENNNNIEVNNKEQENELNQSNKITNLNNNKKDILTEKQKIKPKKNGDTNFEKINYAELERTQNNLKSNLNYKALSKQKLIDELSDIKNILPEYKLNHLKEDEVIYSGLVEKITKIPGKDNKIVYSERFCILTKNYFAYYKSKESYISLNKPLLLIYNNNIKRIENTSFRDNTYYFGIILEINDENKYLVDKVNSFVTNEDNTYELLLGFRTKEFKEMLKWVVILTYFTTQNKDEENQDNANPAQ